MEIDNNKIEIKINELNGPVRAQRDHWTLVDGDYAVTSVTITGKNVGFNPATGILVKVFLSQNTGEMKMFPAKLFYRDVD